MAHFIRTYERIFTAEEKKHIELRFKGNAVDFVGREDLKKRLMDEVLKKKA